MAHHHTQHPPRHAPRLGVVRPSSAPEKSTPAPLEREAVCTRCNHRAPEGPLAVAHFRRTGHPYELAPRPQVMPAVPPELTLEGELQIIVSLLEHLQETGRRVVQFAQRDPRLAVLQVFVNAFEGFVSALVPMGAVEARTLLEAVRERLTPEELEELEELGERAEIAAAVAEVRHG